MVSVDDVKEVLDGFDKALSVSEKVANRAERWRTTYRLSAALLFLIAAGLLLGGVASVRVVVFFALSLTGISILGVRTRIIDAGAMVLRDDSGTQRATLLTEGGHTYLTFYDNESKPRCAMGVTDHGMPLAHFLASDGSPRLMIIGSPEGASVVLLKSHGNPQAYLRIGEEGQPNLTLHSKQGKDKISLTLLEDGTPGLLISGSKCDPAMVSSIAKDGLPHITLFHPSGKPLWSTHAPRGTRDTIE